jgi:hypothetical protein
MAKGKKSTRRRKIVHWTAGDLKVLRQHAGKKSAVAISKLLKRSVAAVRYKAHEHQLSLRSP